MSMLTEHAEHLVRIVTESEVLWHIHQQDCKTSIALFILVAQSVQKRNILCSMSEYPKSEPAN